MHQLTIEQKIENLEELVKQKTEKTRNLIGEVKSLEKKLESLRISRTKTKEVTPLARPDSFHKEV